MPATPNRTATAPGDGRELEAFAPRTLLREQSEALQDNGYPVPPDMRVGHRWAISVRGIPVPRPLTRANRDFAPTMISHYWRELTPEMRQDPRWDPDKEANYGRYEEAFQRLFDEEMRRWDGPGPPPVDKNVAGRKAFRGVRGRTLHFVLEHIRNGGSLLDWPAAVPPPPPPPAPRLWAPRASSRSAAPSSSSRSSASPLLTPKLEQMKVKAEPGLSPLLAELVAAQAGTDDDDIAQAVAAASMNDVPPLDGPAASAWSAFEHAKANGVPFFDVTVDDGAGPSRIKEEDGGAGPSSGGAGVKKEEDPYYAFRRQYHRRQ